MRADNIDVQREEKVGVAHILGWTEIGYDTRVNDEMVQEESFRFDDFQSSLRFVLERTQHGRTD